MIGPRFVESVAHERGGPLLQFAREIEIGPPELPPSAGPAAGEHRQPRRRRARRVERPRVARTRRNLGRAVGSIATGLQHVEVVPGMAAAPAHCHSLEDEIFVVLDGEGTLQLGDAETPVRAGHVIARPAGTGDRARVRRRRRRPHLPRLRHPREGRPLLLPALAARSRFRGIGVIARVEALDYWDGED